MRILYVEDNPANLSLMLRIARMGSHEIVSYVQGEEALANYDRDQPDIVLLDLQLAGQLGGMDVMQALRARGVKTPMVAVTAYAMVGDKERCLAAGFSDYMAKPLQVAELVEKLQRYEAQLAAQAVIPPQATSTPASTPTAAPAITPTAASAANPTPNTAPNLNTTAVTETALPPVQAAPVTPAAPTPPPTPIMPPAPIAPATATTPPAATPPTRSTGERTAVQNPAATTAATSTTNATPAPSGDTAPPKPAPPTVTPLGGSAMPPLRSLS